MISVIIPCHNYGRYLEDCINSLLGGKTSLGDMPGQTLTEWEAIIVNDLSQDNTSEIAGRLVKRDSRIRLVEAKRNLGTSGAFNAGIEVSAGQWIMQLSADDMLESYGLETYLKAQLENRHGFVYGNHQIFAFGKRLRYFFKQEQYYDFYENLIENHVSGTMMYPRQAWVEMGGLPNMPDGREDWATAIALGAWGYCGQYIHRSGYLYRREYQNRTVRNSDDDKKLFAMRITQLFPDIYNGKRPDLVER